MSNYISYSEPINISPKKNESLSYGYPSNEKPKFLFELQVNFTDKTKKIFRKIEHNSETELISISNKIKFVDLSSFDITVIEITSNNTETYSLKDSFKLNEEFYYKKNNDLYVEFIKDNSTNNVVCTCKVLHSTGFFGISPN